MLLLNLFLLLNSLFFGPTVAKLSSPEWSIREAASQRLSHHPAAILTVLSTAVTPEAEERLARAWGEWVWRHVPLYRVQLWASAEKHLSDEWILDHKKEIGRYADVFAPTSYLPKGSASGWLANPPWIKGSEVKDVRFILRSCLTVDLTSPVPQRMEGDQ